MPWCSASKKKTLNWRGLGGVGLFGKTKVVTKLRVIWLLLPTLEQKEKSLLLFPLLINSGRICSRRERRCTNQKKVGGTAVACPKHLF